MQWVTFTLGVETEADVDDADNGNKNSFSITYVWFFTISATVYVFSPKQIEIKLPAMLCLFTSLLVQQLYLV